MNTLETASQPSPNEAPTRSRLRKRKSRFVTRMRQLVAQSQQYQATINNIPCSDLITNWSASRYLLEVSDELARLPKGSDRIKLLDAVINNAVALQRGGYWTPHLKLGEKRLDLANEKHRHAVATVQPAPQKLRDPKAPLNDEDRRAIVDKVDEIFGLK